MKRSIPSASSPPSPSTSLLTLEVLPEHVTRSRPDTEGVRHFGELSMSSRTLVEFDECVRDLLLSVIQVPANIFQLPLGVVLSPRTLPVDVVLRSPDVSSLPQCRIGIRLLTFLGRLDG